MPAPRLPQAKAEVSGAALKNSQRFKDRKAPKRTRPLGNPYVTMTDGERAVWAEIERDMPWLHSGHRLIVRMICHHAARLHTGEEFGTKATQALSSLLSKIGATPSDETKVNHGDDGDSEDPADEFFKSRPS